MVFIVSPRTGEILREERRDQGFRERHRSLKGGSGGVEFFLKNGQPRREG